MKVKNIMKDGLYRNNPILVQLIGLCSVLAVSADASSALGMGISVIFVLLGSNIVVSLLRKFIDNEIRIPAYIVVIATFVSVLQMLLKAYIPDLYNNLGIFLPLIVVNCLILGRAESFSSKNNVWYSALDAIFQGLGYTWTIVVLAIIREFFGAGTFFGMEVLPKEYTIPILTQPAAAFIVLGLLIMAFNAIVNKKAKKELGGSNE